ncbi:MAG: hypothetical protein GY822_25400 [Deltaproteobacteria bacterium]|nr:hypothetical protein [Deltaproteobacteria bacterium]
MMLRIFALGWSGFLQLLRSKVYLNLLVAGVFLVVTSWVIDELSGGMAGRVTIDLGLALCSVVTAILAGVSSIVSVTRQMETQEIHLLLARPMARFEFVLGRFLTSIALVLLSNLVFGLLLAGMVFAMGTEGAWRVLAASLFVSFEGIIVVSIALFFGVKSSSTMSAVFTTTLFLLGRLTLPILDLIQSGKFSGMGETALKGTYALLPHLFAFDLSVWARTGKGIDVAELGQAALYGLFYALVFIAFSSARLENKDLL